MILCSACYQTISPSRKIPANDNLGVVISNEGMVGNLLAVSIDVGELLEIGSGDSIDGSSPDLESSEISNGQRVANSVSRLVAADGLVESLNPCLEKYCLIAKNQIIKVPRPSKHPG